MKTTTLTIEKSAGRQLIEKNRSENQNRVDLEIRAILTEMRSRTAADLSEQRARAKHLRDTRRERGDVLLALWSDWKAWDARGLGYPPENMLAKMMKRTPGSSDWKSKDDDQVPHEYLPMTLVERQAQAQGMYMRIDNYVTDPSFPAAFRDVVVLIYAARMRQEDAARQLGITQPELSQCLQLAREHLAQQYDDMRLRWNAERSQ